MALDFKGPDFKQNMEQAGGIGKKKPKRRQASPQRKAEIRARKSSGGCRVCPNPQGFAIHAHHIVREGAPWFGQWTENNICGLCAECHQAIHSGDDRVKKILRVRLTAAEVRYADERAYEGFVDDVYWRIRPVVTDGQAA